MSGDITYLLNHKLRIWDSVKERMYYTSIEHMLNHGESSGDIWPRFCGLSEWSDLPANKWERYPDCSLPTVHVMPFAGIDNKGNMIYADDVLECHWADKYVCKVVVRFSDPINGFRVERVPFRGCNGYGCVDMRDIHDCELIGNVWEHGFLTRYEPESVAEEIRRDRERIADM